MLFTIGQKEIYEPQFKLGVPLLKRGLDPIDNYPGGSAFKTFYAAQNKVKELEASGDDRYQVYGMAGDWDFDVYCVNEEKKEYCILRDLQVFKIKELDYAQK